MRVRFGALILVLGLTVAVGACGSAPTADIEAAKAAAASAASAGARDYAPESLKAAEDAQAALDAELQAQEGKWFKSYDKAKELAAAVKTASDKAAADAAAGKEKAAAAVAQAITDAKAALAEAQGLLEKAPKGKGSAADLAAMKTDLDNAVNTIAEAETAAGSGKYVDATAKAEAAKNAATSVKTAVETAIAARKR
jgi:hypothetical protein